MRRSMLLAAPLAAALGFAAIGSAEAAPMPRPDGIVAGSKIVEHVQYRRYCWRWRNECARRWGPGGWRYRRCLSIRGCL